MSGDNPATIGHVFPDDMWASAAFCGPNGGNCVEVNLAGRGVVGVRDSKPVAGPVLTIGEVGWRAFLATTRSGGPR
ncbi:DUF397 domain-containing protein [Actinophytocola sp.]|uniref:DUF397 domain-containing protein n=1 Tax=Actinophytocola sp. TaxID=1872138 RepID=UPI002ED0E798